jgi:hypothetical protein
MKDKDKKRNLETTADNREKSDHVLTVAEFKEKL